MEQTSGAVNIFDVYSPKEISEYNRAGYSNGDIQRALDKQLEQSWQQAQNRSDPRQNASHTMVASQVNPNLIEWQLEVDSIIERVEHMLRGDDPVFQHGQLFWIKTKDPSKQIFNDEGVAEIIRVLSVYINRNTLMSNYSEEVINLKIYYLGREISDFIYCKYEKIGMNTLDKRKHYPMIVREICDQVHSAYLRALHGMERESLRKIINVNQTDTLGNHPYSQAVPTVPMRERSMLDPRRYLFGKYY